MKRIKKIFVIAWLELCQWKTDCRVWMVFMIEAVLIMRSMVGLGVYGLVNGTKTTPWVATLLFSDITIAKNLIKILLYLGVVVLFCNAPFVNRLIPSVLLRSKRKSWIWGEIMYIFFGAGIYVSFICLLSAVCVLPSASFNEIWGSSIYQIGTKGIVERVLYIRALVLPQSVISTIYPEYALGYTALTAWFSFSLIGLIIMAFNIGTGKKGPGIVVAGALVMLDPVVAWFASWGPANFWMYRWSPVSWTSIEHLSLVMGAESLSVEYVIGMSVLLISILIIYIQIHTKRLEITFL